LALNKAKEVLMANSQAEYKELRFKIKPDKTEAYAFIECKDMPMVTGWYFKEFPLSLSIVGILKTMPAESALSWEKRSPGES
jgi:hypothetical protein